MTRGNDGIRRQRTGEAGKARYFREREILIRTDGTIRYIRLRPWMQKLATGVALSVLIWATGVTAFSQWQQVQIDAKREEIAEAKLTYENLRSELKAYQGQVADIADRFAGQNNDPDLNEHITDIAGLSRNLADALSKISTDLDMSKAERERIIKSRDMLHERIRALEVELSEAHAEIGELTRSVAAVSSDLDTVRQENRVLTEARKTLRTRVGVLEDGLAASRTHGLDLEGRISQLSSTLAAVRSERARLAESRDGLQGRAQALTAALGAARLENEETTKRVAEVASKLAAARRLSMLVPSDQSALQALESESRSVLQELSTSRARVDQVELALTTVVTDLERLLGADGPTTLHTASAMIGPAPARLDPVERARSLISDLSTLQDTQKSLLSRLSDRSVVEIQGLESLMELAGLKEGDVKLPSDPRGGQGGPLIEVSLAEGGNGYVQSVMRLEGNVTQLERLRQLSACLPWIAPVDSFQLTSNFGKRRDPITGRMAMHQGIDLAGWAGTPVLATSPGRVTFAGNKTGYGKFVEIDHGCGVVTRYAHLRKITVKSGEVLTHRAQIGTLGTTGRSTGPHVHYEVVVNGREVDPAKFLEAGRNVFR